MPAGYLHDPAKRQAAVDDYHHSGDSIKTVAARHGIGRTTLGSWIRPPDQRSNAKWMVTDIPYEGGWVVRNGVQYPTEPARRAG